MKRFFRQLWCGLRGHKNELVADRGEETHMRVSSLGGSDFVKAMWVSYLWCPRCDKETHG